MMLYSLSARACVREGKAYGKKPCDTVTDTPHSIVVFRLGSDRHAVSLGVVERAIRAAEVTPVADAPGPVLGLLDVAGTVLPVLSLRRRLRQPEPEISIDAHFLIVRMGSRPAALAVDEVLAVDSLEGSIEPGEIIPGLEQYGGIVRRHDGLVFIHDLERFFSPADWHRVDEMMAAPP
jgi:purine-binding chemotaxis protein CheW